MKFIDILLILAMVAIVIIYCWVLFTALSDIVYWMLMLLFKLGGIL